MERPITRRTFLRLNAFTIAAISLPDSIAPTNTISAFVTACSSFAGFWKDPSMTVTRSCSKISGCKRVLNWRPYNVRCISVYVNNVAVNFCAIWPAAPKIVIYLYI